MYVLTPLVSLLTHLHKYTHTHSLSLSRTGPIEAASAVLEEIKKGGPNVKEALGSENAVGTILEGKFFPVPFSAPSSPPFFSPS